MLRSLSTTSLAAALFVTAVEGHIAPWGAGMFCKNGYYLSNTDQPNNNEVVNPLFNLTFNDWFMHGQCRNFPPPAGEFLNLPAGGSFTVEMAGNRGQTTLSFNGQFTSMDNVSASVICEDYVSSHVLPLEHPEYENGSWNNSCIITPNLHTKNHQDVAGSAFAIAYKSDISQVQFNDLVVFSVAGNTPWRRVQSFDVPQNMPACPSGGCICAWGWVPNNCGEPNMYMAPWKCQVTNVASTAQPLQPPRDPVWCEGNVAGCVQGAKKMIAWHQLDGNNVNTDGQPAQADGQARSPGYNEKMGFTDGAQNDIFVQHV
ncbi:hypothetical protein EXIGLDRAFT_830633 [Exidia glandulosa HHB12029]|uniref:Uncharacterized protein n=1 Tax=Exidia glandulosa HHB12029 TaxID=1314781 RepID=A0A165NAN6_EXIGL|nr:hypothetical protein EXIGLDRAFT_830633 [Exidia glandulosa HHB12029]